MFARLHVHIVHKAVRLSLLAAGLALLVVVFPSFAVAQVSCGQEIRTSITLTADLGPCPGNGLVITGPLPGEPNITVNLNGHNIIGSGTDSGLWVLNGGAVVKSGFIRNFGTGVFIDQATDVMAYSLQIYNNATGVRVLFSSGVRVFDNTVIGQAAGTTGISASDSEAFIYRNTITENSGVAVWVGTAIATVSGNLIKDNNAGIFLAGEGVWTVRGNGIFNNKGNAVQVEPSGGNCRVEENDIDWNAGHGVIVRNIYNCLIQNNRISHSGLNGISITGGGLGYEVKGNRLSRNAIDLFWDGLGESCWRQNVFRTSSPAALPVCPGF